MSSPKQTRRSKSFWFMVVVLSLSVLLLVLGQTLAVFDYELAVDLGLQEDVSSVTEFGVQINRAIGASDTLIYLPLIVLSLAGLIYRKPWALFTTAAVMGISSYWTAIAVFMFWFLPGIENYTFTPTPDYWIFIGSYFLFGLWGLWYIIFHGEKLIQ